jgi:phosphoribosylaminoimidazole (AIR) synthetase
VKYEDTGVSLETAEIVAGRLRTAVESTWTGAAGGPFGVFAGLYALDDERLLAATTDGVGN